MFSENLVREIDHAIANVLPEVVAFRQERHKYPELTWREKETAAAVAEKLAAIDGIEVTEGVGRLGVVGVLCGAEDGPTIALRADMDALPVEEKTGKPYASRHAGVMHACGHDGHMANLMGAALVLSGLRHKMRGKIKFIFQPAEEGGAGADVMCREGALANPDVDVIFGLHGWPVTRVGRVAVKSGPILASTLDFKVTIVGTGCHAAMPHLGTDQVLIGAKIVDALQAIPSRHMSPSDCCVLTVGKFHGGTTTNVIPSEATLEGTWRTVNAENQAAGADLIKRLSQSIAESHGARAEVEIRYGYPATVNHSQPTTFVSQVADALLGQDAVEQLAEPSMGGEDFAYFLEKVPGCYFFLGVDDGRQGGYPSLHHPCYDFNDEALMTGIKMFAGLALGYERHQPLS